jgi:DNA-binding transcriptional MocR family regulator
VWVIGSKWTKSEGRHKRAARLPVGESLIARAPQRDSSQIQFTSQHLAHHLRTTRAIYNERRLAFLEEAQILDGVLEFAPAIAGMHVTGLFRDANIDDRAVVAESVRRGVPVDPLSK